MPKSTTKKFYAVYDQTHALGGVYTEWSAAENALQKVKAHSGTGGLVKKFCVEKDAEYFVNWGTQPPEPSIYSTDPNSVVAYTDGSCRMNLRGVKSAGLGVYFGEHHPCNVAEPFTRAPLTNNRAELTAIQRAIEIVHDPANKENFPTVEEKPRLVIYTDSSYARDALGDWRKSWQQTNFRDDTVLNRDVIEPIWKLMDVCEREILLVWRKGHAGIYGNEMADRLANRGALAE